MNPPRVRACCAELATLAKALLSATRDEPSSVLAAVDAAARALEPAVDAVLYFERDHDAFVCGYASGARAVAYRGARFDATAGPSGENNALYRAWRHGHRIEGGANGGAAVLPRDRAFLALPLREGDRVIAVLYLASTRGARFQSSDALVTLAELAAPALRCSLERHADRVDASIDGLTGLLTPRAFRAALGASTRNGAAQSGTRLALLFVDTDHFKACNDRHGHAAGDAVLRALAAALTANAPPAALAGRNGGDEFCLLFPVLGKSDAVRHAEAIRAAVERLPYASIIGGRPEVPISASIGVALYPDDATTPDRLLERADEAMYESKRNGRNRVSFVKGGAFPSEP